MPRHGGCRGGASTTRQLERRSAVGAEVLPGLTRCAAVATEVRGTRRLRWHHRRGFRLHYRRACLRGRRRSLRLFRRAREAHRHAGRRCRLLRGRVRRLRCSRRDRRRRLRELRCRGRRSRRCRLSRSARRVRRTRGHRATRRRTRLVLAAPHHQDPDDDRHDQQERSHTETTGRIGKLLSGFGGLGSSLAFFRYSRAKPFAGWSSSTACRFVIATFLLPAK